MTDKLREAAERTLRWLDSETPTTVDAAYAEERAIADDLRAALAQQPSATDHRVVIEWRDGATYINGREIGPGTLEIRRDGVTYRAAERVAVQPEPVQEPLVWEPVVRDLPALTQREYDALHAHLRWNYKRITPPKVEPVQEPVQEPVANNPDPYHLSRILHELAGSASMCWEHVDRAGVFQSTQATEVVAAAIAEIRQRMKDAPPQRPPLTDEEMLDIIDDAFEGASLLDVVRAVERKVRGE